jgi:hypothetical protein
MNLVVRTKQNSACHLDIFVSRRWWCRNILGLHALQERLDYLAFQNSERPVRLFVRLMYARTADDADGSIASIQGLILRERFS